MSDMFVKSMARVTAETRLRGSLMFELHAAVAETGRRKSVTEGPMVMLGYITVRGITT
jgi:hypothetical protein